MGRVERKTLFLKDEGMVCTFICPLVVKQGLSCLFTLLGRSDNWTIHDGDFLSVEVFRLEELIVIVVEQYDGISLRAVENFGVSS